MASMKKITMCRTIVWEGESSQTTITIDDYIQEMKEYGKQKSRSVRTARRYLRSLGLELNRDGEVIGSK